MLNSHVVSLVDCDATGIVRTGFAGGATLAAARRYSYARANRVAYWLHALRLVPATVIVLVESAADVAADIA